MVLKFLYFASQTLGYDCHILFAVNVLCGDDTLPVGYQHLVCLHDIFPANRALLYLHASLLCRPLKECLLNGVWHGREQKPSLTHKSYGACRLAVYLLIIAHEQRCVEVAAAGNAVGHLAGGYGCRCGVYVERHSDAHGCHFGAQAAQCIALI